MNKNTRIQLSVMMFLEFFVWGSWFVSLGSFLVENLQATGLQSASVFSTQSYGAIIAPFIIGLIADKYFNAERILGILHLIGAGLMFMMFRAESVETFYPYVFGYMIGYMPTLALVNSVSFRQMKDPEKEFSNIRVWGTVGWILAGWAISLLFRWDSKEAMAAGQLKNTFAMAGIGSLILGLFSFTLPKTPPVKNNTQSSIGSMLGLDAIKLLANKNFLVFFVSAILICIPLAFYYQVTHDFLKHVGMEDITAKMTIGQISEALFILALPIFFKRYGFKKTILVGMLAWAVRYTLFAYGNADERVAMLLVGLALHGVCYDFFFVSGQIYTDQKAGEQYKSAAQGLVTLATYGVGMLIGFWVAGFVTDHYKDAVNQWQMIWLIPAGIAIVIALLFTALFRDEKKQAA